ncbi:hypothetical protein B0O80DRAFT_436691 [Mortierella sp. GBAus27b]|nr:hypothetical protein BGX31_006429 [Mortierella sp. GBA43]KAI8361102.1 hypothetical protein B0O80DRAFT_436691 [Mortierella sp. GBAus27b]
MNTIPASMAGMLGAGHRSTDRSRPALLSFQNFLQFHQHLQQQLLQVQQQQQQQALFHGLGIVGSPDESRSIGLSSPSSIPDVNYVADVIAQQLLPFGADLFNNKQDANCVLVVENQRYFVHVQMLAARSATFRHIFDDMIRSDAWSLDMDDRDDDDSASHGDTSTSASNSTLDEDTDFSAGHDDDDEVFVLDEDIDRRAMYEDTGIMDEMETMSMEGTLCDDQESGAADDEHGLPVLELTFADPVGSHFNELLYWLYTDDCPRWRACFTPQNYDSILENIRILNLFTPTVFDICESFEQTTHPEMGLKGKAAMLFN